MKNIFYFIIIIKHCLLFLHGQNISLKKIKFNKVIAYSYNGNKGQLIVNQGKLYKKAVIKSKILLTEEYSELNNTLFDYKTYGSVTKPINVKCIGVVYYFNDSIVGHVSFNFRGNYLTAFPKIEEIEKNRVRLKGEQYYTILEGFSEKGKLALVNFFDSIHIDCVD